MVKPYIIGRVGKPQRKMFLVGEGTEHVVRSFGFRTRAWGTGLNLFELRFADLTWAACAARGSAGAPKDHISVVPKARGIPETRVCGILVFMGLHVEPTPSHPPRDKRPLLKNPLTSAGISSC